MSAYVPIPSSVKDAFYRYKREVIHLVQEHKNGVQSRLVNLEKIANQLKVSHDNLTKHLRKHLQCHIANGVIPGKMSVAAVEEALEVYIEEHVLCKRCRLPELVGAKGDVRCNACGHSAAEGQEMSKADKKKAKKTEKESRTESKSSGSASLLADDAEPSLEDSGGTDLDLKLCRTMHQLYDLRDHYLAKRGLDANAENRSATSSEGVFEIIIARAEAYLAKCWDCRDSKTYRAIKEKIKLFGEEIDAGKVVKPASSPDLPSMHPSKNRSATSPEGVSGESAERKDNLIRSASAVDVSRGTMMLCKSKAARLDDIFQLPLGQGALHCREFIAMYPEFAAEMNGSNIGACLLFFYEQNPVTKEYVLKDSDAEYDIAAALGMDLGVAIVGESDAEAASRKERKPKIAPRLAPKGFSKQRPAVNDE
jgi:uncharacterized Zn finger protein (UPF0148 family)